MATQSDILILSSSKDNRPLTEGEVGWVSSFQKFLELMLIQVLGDKLTIDLKTDAENITAADLKNVGLLIPIISSDFLSSGACTDAVETFMKTYEKKNENFGRIFKVIKSSLKELDEPKKLKRLISYDLYYLDEESGSIQEINDYFGPDAERNYWMKLVDLAYDLHESLLHLKEADSPTEVKPLFSRRAVYLAETSHDLIIQRNIIRRELQRHGYRVLPDHTLPGTLEDLEEVVKKELNECNMSIHLIGSSYGDIPHGSERSVVDLQNKIASEIDSSNGRDTKLSRLIWISPELKSLSEKQKTFIENIKRDISTLEGAEILQTPLEDFKNIIREELINVSDDKKFAIDSKKDSNKDKNNNIYIVYDLIDKKEVTPLIKHVEKLGYNVLHPDFDGELLELREKHIKNLVEFDKALVFHGKVNLQWVRMKLLDLLKAPGFGRNKPVLGRGIVTAKGVKMQDKIFGVYDVELYDGSKDLPLDDIKKFLETK